MEMTAEEKYRLLLEVTEAANSQRDLTAVLEAVVEGLAASIPVEAVGMTVVEKDHVVPRAVYIRGVERRQGDSFADTMNRWFQLSGDSEPPGYEPLPLAGTGTEHVGRTGKAWVCEDLTQRSRFPEDALGRLSASFDKAAAQPPQSL